MIPIQMVKIVTTYWKILIRIVAGVFCKWKILFNLDPFKNQFNEWLAFLDRKRKEILKWTSTIVYCNLNFIYTVQKLAHKSVTSLCTY